MIEFQSGECDCTSCILDKIDKQKEIKSANTEPLNERIAKLEKYYGIKSASKKEEKPYYISLMEQFGYV
jgi:hypothetical protein